LPKTAAHDKGDNASTAMKSVVVDPDAYDWEGDRPLHRPSSQTIVYEMHVRGFTRHPNSGGSEQFQTDAYWRDHILFYEYFHGDNGAGLGASHQTGRTR
jgi:1,4-alpha-glucan branching enzyme